jgi:hypothetical protein
MRAGRGVIAPAWGSVKTQGILQGACVARAARGRKDHKTSHEGGLVGREVEGLGGTGRDEGDDDGHEEHEHDGGGAPRMCHGHLWHMGCSDRTCKPGLRLL